MDFFGRKLVNISNLVSMQLILKSLYAKKEIGRKTGAYPSSHPRYTFLNAKLSLKAFSFSSIGASVGEGVGRQRGKTYVIRKLRKLCMFFLTSKVPRYYYGLLSYRQRGMIFGCTH